MVVKMLPQGKRLMTITEYAKMLMPYECEDDYVWINQHNLVSSGSDDDLYVVQTDKNHFKLLPGPEFSPRLYRGQPEFYENCIPKLCREKTDIDYIVALIKKYEFYKLIIESHPIIHELLTWNIDDKYFEMDMEGLSQHYEFSTQMMDVTRSKDIAMFFALCDKNETTNQYEPIFDESRVVVLYTINMHQLLKKTGLNIVGFQALPRPDAQRAFSIYLDWNENFNLQPYVKYEKFQVKCKLSEKYYNLFEGGTKLFPKDIVDSKALEIELSKKFDRDVLERCFKEKLIPRLTEEFSDFIKILISNGYIITEKKLTFSNNEKKEIILNWEARKSNYFQRIKYRLASDSLYG